MLIAWTARIGVGDWSLRDLGLFVLVAALWPTAGVAHPRVAELQNTGPRT